MVYHKSLLFLRYKPDRVGVPGKGPDANYLLNKEYESLLARAREESMETIQNLKEQVEDQRQKIEQLQSTIRWKNDREKETDQLVAGKTDNLNDQIRILEKKLSKMQDVLLEKDALIEEQKAQLTDYEEILNIRRMRDRRKMRNVAWMN